MKFIIKLAFICFIGVQSFKSYSQANLNDIYQTGSTWFENHTHELGMGTRYLTDYLIEIGSDTTINSVTYKKLNLKRRFIGTMSIVDYRTIGGIRVNAKKVYFIRTKTLPGTVNDNFEPQSSINAFPLLNEITLYDFDLVQGTTLSWKPTNSTVLSTGSVVVNNQTFSTYTFWAQTPYYETWKEGLGSEQGFFGSYRSFNYTSRFEPQCFSSPNLTYPANCSIPVISGVKDFSNDESVIIYPNPVVSTFVNIAAPHNFRIQKIEIYNALGKVVFQKNYQATPAQINLDLSSGVYSARFISESGETITRKIFKH